jgi:hypothetical protein
MLHALLLVHVAATWYMVGLCWLIQRVQYPLLARVGRDAFVGYEHAHVERITPVVAPPMAIELASGLALLAWSPGLGGSGFAISMLLLAAIWLSTLCVQVPLHRALSQRFDPDTHLRLVRTNWLRTTAWSARGLIVLGVLWEVLASGTSPA